MRTDVLKVSGTTADQRARWRVAAGGGTRDLSAWVRAAVDAAAAGTTLPAHVAAADALRTELAGLRADLSRGVGNNLNQIAHRLHADATTGAADVSAHGAALVAAAQDVAAMRVAVTRALGPGRRRRP